MRFATANTLNWATICIRIGNPTRLISASFSEFGEIREFREIGEIREIREIGEIGECLSAPFVL